MTATRPFLLVRLREGLDALGPFPAGEEFLTEAEVARMMLEEAIGHRMRLMEWRIASVGSAKQEFVDLQTKATCLLEAMEKATLCQWHPGILRAILKARGPLEDLLIKLAPRIQFLEAQSANAHLRVQDGIPPETALYIRATVILNLAGKPADNPRGKGSFRALVDALHALGTGENVRNYAPRGAQAIRKLKEAQPHLSSKRQKEALDYLVAVRKRIEDGSPLASFQVDEEWQEHVRCLESLLTDYCSPANP